MVSNKIKGLILAKEDLGAKHKRLEDFVSSFNADDDAMKMWQDVTHALSSVAWAERVCRAAAAIEEERTPDGVSDTLVDELCKAIRGE